MTVRMNLKVENTKRLSIDDSKGSLLVAHRDFSEKDVTLRITPAAGVEAWVILTEKEFAEFCTRATQELCDKHPTHRSGAFEDKS
jgi:hypothetical protein